MSSGSHQEDPVLELDEEILPPDVEKFLAYSVYRHVKNGLLSAAAAFENAPLKTIMSSYEEDSPNRRAEVIAKATGISLATALNLPLAVREQLFDTWLATNEPEKNKQELTLEAVSPEDLVRYADKKKLVEQLKAARALANNLPNARVNAAELLDKLIELKMLGEDTPFRIYELITFDRLALLPSDVLAKAVQYVAFKIKRRPPHPKEGDKPEIGVKDLYETINSQVLATLDLDIIEKVFTAFEVKYKLMDGLDEQPTVPPAKGTDAANAPVDVPRLNSVNLDTGHANIG